MTVPALGLPFDDVPKPDAEDLKLRSVTTIIGVLDKPGLIYWAANEAALCAIHDAATWQSMLERQGETETAKWIAGARFRTTGLTAAARGTCVHAVCEEYALTGVRPDKQRVREIVWAAAPKLDADAIKEECRQVWAFVDSLDVWLQQFQPVYQAAEVTVYSPKYGYAGTTDAFVVIDGVRFIVDYKTAKDYDNQGKPTRPYPEQVGLQLAAYRYAEAAAVWRPRRFEERRSRWYLLSQAEQDMAVPVPEVDHGLVIHITQERCEAYPVDCGPEAFNAFLFTSEASRWVNETSRTVMGPPLVAKC